MDALAGTDDRVDGRVIHPAYRVRKHTRGVHHNPCFDGVLHIGLCVPGHQAAHNVACLAQSGHLNVVQHRRALFGGRLRHVHGKSGIVELAVVVDHAAPKALRLNRGDSGDGVLTRQILRMAETVLSGKPVIESQPYPIERPGPPVIAGHYKWQIVHQVGGVLPEQASFLECLQNQRHIPLLQVPHTAVDQFRTAARCTLGEVPLFQKEDLVAAGGRIDRGSQAGRPAPDHDHIPGLGCVRHPPQHLIPVHYSTPIAN